jgi:TetR/AcrR family transcriptional regulator, regulator of autoinduction and epiphytic fitness
MGKISFKEQVALAREEAIVEAVNRLLADKGYDNMTVDEVAAEVGIAKASLYKHFGSKEKLAAAAMIRALERAQGFLDNLEAQPPVSALERLKAVVRWTMEVQLAGEMPSLPAQNSALRAVLLAHREYLDLLMVVSDRLGAWIVEAQQAGQIQPGLPPELVLYTIFARACDPVLGMLKASGQHSGEAIVNWLVSTTFDGLSGSR